MSLPSVTDFSQELDFECQVEKVSGFGLDTLAIRTGINTTHEGEHSEPIYATSSYVYKDSAQSAAVFSGKEQGNVYSRFTNPTVRLFEQRIAALEKAEAAIATASGMSAVMASCMALLKSGDHVIFSRDVFGSTIFLLKNFFEKFGVEVSYVDLTDYEQWQSQIKTNTKLLFCETPSNPMMHIADIEKLAAIAHQYNALLIVDNTFCTPILQQPLAMGADIVIHSTGKYIDGQGRCVGGVVLSSQEIVDKVIAFMRCAGPAMSPYNASHFIKGLETLSLRMQRHCSNAMQIAQWLESCPQVEQVIYTGLSSHPQHALACRQQRDHSGIVSFKIKGDQALAWKMIDSTKLISKTTNVGDAKTMVTHPASTTHCKWSEEDRARAGITDNLIRLTVGLENVEDLIADLKLGLQAIA